MLHRWVNVDDWASRILVSTPDIYQFNLHKVRYEYSDMCLLRILEAEKTEAPATPLYQRQ